MAGVIHENVKMELLKSIRDILKRQKKDDSLVEPEWKIYLEGKINIIDVALRNLRLVCEVEPAEPNKPTGFKQLKDYAEKALRITGYENVFGILAWGLDSRGEQWDCEIYEFYFDENKNLTYKSLGGKSEIEAIVPIAVKGVLPLTAENFLSIFFPVKEYFEKLKEIFNNHSDDYRLKTFYESYGNALQILYVKAINQKRKDKRELKELEEKIKELFIIHTIIQMIAIAILNRIKDLPFRPGELEILTGIGKDYNVSLPFLEWWYKLKLFNKLEDKEIEILKNLSREIGNKVLVFNWEEKNRDIFRLLYESFISEEDRRKFGEYYTPPWLVNFTLEKLGNLKDKLVVDPFCGSGTFLDYAFRKKVEEGEDPDRAYRNLLGFDINPLAVLLARVELSISYFHLTGKFPDVSPQIFYVNSLEAVNKYSIGKLFITDEGEIKPLFLYKIKELVQTINIQKLYSQEANLSLSKLVEFENILAYLLRNLEKEIQKNRNKAKYWYESFILKLKKQAPELAIYFEVLDKEKVIELLEKYGDSVWSIAITSLYSIGLFFLKRENKEIYVVSNPPWIPLTEVEGKYGEVVRDKVKQYFRSVPKQAYNAGDIASLFLKAWTNYGKKVAFVVSSKVAYDSSLYGLGKILTYEAVKNNCTVYFIKYDVFKHGIFPSVVIYGTGENLACRVKPISSKISKDEKRVSFEIEKCENYTEYIKALKLYANLDVKKLTKQLRVNKVYKMGTYIRGLFSGEKKKGKESYAGLILKDVKCTPFLCKVRLWNTESYVEIEEKNLIKKLIYMGKVYPFWIGTYDCLLSEKGESELKKVLKGFLSQEIPDKDKRLIEKLIKEVKQGRLITLKPNRWYVVARQKRVFAAGVVEGENNLVLESSVIALETGLKEQAYYYSAVLNYLIKKAEKNFIRNQYARPFLAIVITGLEWQGMKWQYDIGKISEEIHTLIRTKKLFENIPLGYSAQKAIRKLYEEQEIKNKFEQIVEEFNRRISQENLEKALRFVREPV